MAKGLTLPKALVGLALLVAVLLFGGTWLLGDSARTPAMLRDADSALLRYLERSPGERLVSALLKGKDGQRAAALASPADEAAGAPEQRALGKIFDTPPEDVVALLGDLPLDQMVLSDLGTSEFASPLDLPGMAVAGPAALGGPRFGPGGLGGGGPIGGGGGPIGGGGGAGGGGGSGGDPGGGPGGPGFAPPVVASPVPEPATWVLLIGGFFVTAAAMRRRRSTTVPALA